MAAVYTAVNSSRLKTSFKMHHLLLLVTALGNRSLWWSGVLYHSLQDTHNLLILVLTTLFWPTLSIL